jgi:uncharacterized repeat protein (TIGR03803 family)
MGAVSLKAEEMRGDKESAMRHRDFGSILFVLTLIGCSLAGSNSTSPSSAMAERADSHGSSIAFRTLYSFGYHQSDGAQPQSALYRTESCTQTCQEHLYGTTAAGGANNAGTVYDVYTYDQTQGYYDGMVVMNFSPTATGSDPMGSVILAAHRSGGTLLTTASQGGAHGKGTVVSVHTGITLSFDGHNGSLPTSGLTATPQRQHGYLFYTTTSEGGAHGLGTILAIGLSKDKLTSRVLYSFTGNSDGAHPNSAFSSSFFGTTSGSKTVPATVYEFNPGLSSVPTTIYTFTSSKDGAQPTGVAVLVKHSVPVLYGTTVQGGAAGYGTLYELKKTGSSYKKVTLHTFAGGSADGAYPQGSLANVYYYGKFSGFYGVTEKGGSHDCGTIFRINLLTAEYAVVYSFKCGKDGAYPEAPLVFGADGLAGTTSADGAYHGGTVFTFKTP